MAYLRTKWHLNPSSHLATMHICRKMGDCVPLVEREQAPHLIVAEAYLHAKFHLDLSNCLATIHQRYRQTDRIAWTGQTTV